jgi:hypothetical protein
MLKRHAASARESQTAKPFLPRMNADGADRKTRRQEAGPSGKAGPSRFHLSNSKPELLGTLAALGMTIQLLIVELCVLVSSGPRSSALIRGEKIFFCDLRVLRS